MGVVVVPFVDLRGPGRAGRAASPATGGLVALLYLAFGLASGTAAPAAEAQQQTTTLVGTVAGADGRPLRSAQLVVTGTRLQTLSQQAGGFRIDGVPLGRQTLEVSFVGYRTVQIPLELAAGAALRVEVRLELNPVDIHEVEVQAMRAMAPELRGFYERRSRGSGHFFTHEDIGRMQARAFTDVLRRVPGVNVRPGSGRYGSNNTIQMGRATGISGSRACPVLYYMNGQPFPVSPEIGINHFVRPDEIAALEVYSGSSRVPSQFHASRHNARCGVVVIWTRSGPVQGSEAR